MTTAALPSYPPHYLRPFSPDFLTHDFEFIDDGNTIDPVSMAMVSGDGRSLYAVFNSFDQKKLLAHDWMRENVWPHLPTIKLDRNGSGACRCIQPCSCVHGKLDMNHPSVRSPQQIARMVSDFILESHPVGKPIKRDNVSMWAWYAAYDHVTLAQMFGPMIELPKHVPMLTLDLKQEAIRLGDPKLAEQPSAGVHNALEDAFQNLSRARQLFVMEQDLRRRYGIDT